MRPEATCRERQINRSWLLFQQREIKRTIAEINFDWSAIEPARLCLRG